jgi:transcriptional regulator with XRE-family HTH domain
MAAMASQLAQHSHAGQIARRAPAANDSSGTAQGLVDGFDPDEEAEGQEVQGLAMLVNPAQRKAALRQVIGRRLRAARLLQGLDQGQASGLLGHESSTQLSLWEAGKRLAPLDRIVAAAGVFGVTVDFLTGLSEEPYRDTQTALRSATLNGVRAMLVAASEGVVDLFERHAALIGPDATSVAAIVDVSQALRDAVAALMRSNPEEFNELRGGATLARRATEFDDVVQATRDRLAAHRALGDDLQAQLRRSMATG